MTEAKSPPKWGELPRVNANAAGLDVGASEIVACVPRDRAEEPIRSFGTCTPDLQALASWLKECGIETVAMEATGVYWIPLYEILERDGFRPCMRTAFFGVRSSPKRNGACCECIGGNERRSSNTVRPTFSTCSGLCCT